MATDPNALAVLPPEILDKILEQIPTDSEGLQTLIACALVATWWTGPSQRCLFSSVEIDEYNYQRWINGVVSSRSKVRLLNYVRSLWHCRGRSSRVSYRMRHLALDSGEYLSALYNIHTFTLAKTWIEPIGEDHLRTCFSAFRETITHLSFESIATSFSAFVTLVDYFPNIKTLGIDWLRLEPDEGPVPVLSRPLRGKLSLYDFRGGSLDFFSRFARLDLEYEELVISWSSFVYAGMQALEGVLKICTSTVRSLRLTSEFPPEVVLSIRDFRRLRELELVAAQPGSPHEAILSSITSTELQKIIFLVSLRNGRIFVWSAEEWTLIDKYLCRLVDRLHTMGYRHTLEAELRLTEVDDPGKYDFTTVLSEFKEKGVVTVVDAVHGDRVLYSSARNR